MLGPAAAAKSLSLVINFGATSPPLLPRLKRPMPPQLRAALPGAVAGCSIPARCAAVSCIQDYMVRD